LTLVFWGILVGVVAPLVDARLEPDAPFLVLITDGKNVDITSLTEARSRVTRSRASHVTVKASDEGALEDALEKMSYGLGHADGTVYLASVRIKGEADGGAFVELSSAETEHRTEHSRYYVKNDVVTPVAHYASGELVDLVALAIAVILAFVSVRVAQVIGRRHKARAA